MWGQVRPPSGAQPYRLQQFRNGRWGWVGDVRFTIRSGFFRRVVVAGRGARLRVWSVRDRRYSTVLTVY